MPTIQTLSELEGSPHATVFPDSEPKTIRLTLSAGESVATHSHPGRDIVFHLLDGRIELGLDGEEHEIAGGEIARFAGEAEISPTALEDSTALIVLAERAD